MKLVAPIWTPHDPWKNQIRGTLCWLWFTKPDSGRSSWAKPAFKDIRMLIAKMIRSRDYLVLEGIVFQPSVTHRDVVYRPKIISKWMHQWGYKHSVTWWHSCHRCNRPLYLTESGLDTVCPIHLEDVTTTSDDEIEYSF